MTTLTPISELIGLPAIGETYLVPCIRAASFAPMEASTLALCVAEDGEFMPVIGTKHNDARYGFGAVTHYHFDYRFLRQGLMDWIDLRRSGLTGPPESPLDWVLPEQALHEDFAHLEPMVCLREMPEHEFFHNSNVWLLQPHFKDKRIDPKDPMCAHHKVCLASLKAKDGAVTCPAHGLRWNLKSGELIPHPKPTETEKGEP